MKQQPNQLESIENWDGIWLTDRGYILTIKNNMITVIESKDGTILTGILFERPIFKDGETDRWGRLMHKRGFEEDLRKKWNR